MNRTNMKINENYKTSLQIAQNSNLITDVVYKKLLENCFSVLTGKEEVHNISNLYNSKPDVVKEVYAALLAVSAEFARNNLSKDEIVQFLTSDCKLPTPRANIFAEFFEKNKRGVEVALLNIGSCLPHVTDVKWKIDYVVKSNVVDQSDGPLFRISLSTEEFDSGAEVKRVKNVNFTCTSQELQDLVYKLKDAVLHCSNFIHRIL